MLTSVKAFILKSVLALGYKMERADAKYPYDSDGLRVQGKHVPFLGDERFMSAYRRGMSAYGRDLHIEWRLAVTCWAARHGANLPGDFVECGVNNGCHSLAICEYVGFNSLDKSFYLFDTYRGIPDEQRSDRERASGHSHEGHYNECYEATRANFAPFPRAVLVRGKVPDTLPTTPIKRVAYLSLDMNIAYPERKAIEYFWPRLSPGAMVVLDDYGWYGYEEQMAAMDEFARGVGVEILTLPTGQGLLVKP